MKKLLAICTFLTFSNCKEFDSFNTPKTAEQLKLELKIQEEVSPQDYLKADGNYKENFWGDKLKINCIVKNNATLASYKDAVLKIRYFSKTKTEIANKEMILYEVFPPNSTKTIELKLKNYSDVNSIGWEIINAIPLD
ncbi:hypothetical protein SY27_00890 [Flavobacterium sp. 316]|uniref:hypothetical protein n=1 Tax=Flavobacterium sp. 316 TaxID=1603293 RepID=UPI0005DBFE2F|nr:hypothetical protein [Flavobacterium sp. 316]KIX22440.1 hypothetical protein SY27_00890 [Flavobacterium sp. 316]